MVNRTPTYNLKAVLKETGLKADVLRAWERRYDLPKPDRTPGGHRLYSEYDIETCKWLRARQAEGLSISRAVDLWKELSASGADPLAKYAAAPSHPAVAPWSTADASIDVLRQNWLEAVLAFDGLRADDVLNQAFAIYPVEMVCTGIIQQGIAEVGQGWYANRISAQQEHFASALATRRLEALIAATPLPTRRKTVLIGCPPGEWHIMPSLLLNLFLRRRGLSVVYLGADIPIEQMGETAAAIQPDLVILSAQLLTTAVTLQAAAQTLHEQGILLAYGGLVFNRIPRLRAYIPAHFLGESLDEAMEMVERLVIAPLPFDVQIPDRDLVVSRELAGLYREKRHLIENALYQDLQKVGLQPDLIQEANGFLGAGLAASLELGDPSFLEADLDWVEHLRTGRRLPADRLLPYLAAYGRALSAELGQASAPITAWIDKLKEI